MLVLENTRLCHTINLWNPHCDFFSCYTFSHNWFITFEKKITYMSYIFMTELT